MKTNNTEYSFYTLIKKILSLLFYIRDFFSKRAKIKNDRIRKQEREQLEKQKEKLINIYREIDAEKKREQKNDKTINDIKDRLNERF